MFYTTNNILTRYTNFTYQTFKMDTTLLVITFNGRWTSAYQYIDHDTKVILWSHNASFNDFLSKIYEVSLTELNKFEIDVWFI